MLSKTKKDIPPGLIATIRTEKSSKKTLLLMGASALIVAIGFVAVFVYNYYLIPEFKKSNKPVQQNSMAQIEKTQQTEPVQAKMEQTSTQVKSVEPEVPEQTTKTKLTEPPTKNVKNPIEKHETSTQEKSLKQTASEKKANKPAEIPLEQFNTETVRAADYLYRAQDLETKGNYSEAISEYKEYLKVTGKQEPKILNKIATLYLLIGNLTEASHYAEIALQQAPDSLAVLLNYGVIHAKMGNLLKAEECFRKVLSVSPENKIALYNLALLKEKKKEYKEALKLYEKLYQLGDSQAAEAIERVRSYIK
ncbi:tetratricopeptide repeat protein [Thermodesulfovibrio yellowstonii]|uniref:Tetratricopeptide repeat domain protein n=1 Tax=Thermodesulfovibrio yellowstonii (strain ATCC 51303 / DSM 11347 / YP87) TaxID=289376 RepID=B5YGA2_THEYD|nr:tetratricopeptide repeat protein [Thermodesulfovibrio yellowstonii]ACI20253.1 tetratricopeptide repeat domain protein [Thermodesulfovibrio yellowstonii DSM 11347]